MGFFPTLCVYRLTRGGGRGVGGGDRPLRESFCPSTLVAVSLGEPRLLAQTHTHTRVSRRALIRSGGRDEGQRVRQRETGGAG